MFLAILLMILQTVSGSVQLSGSVQVSDPPAPPEGITYFDVDFEDGTTGVFGGSCVSSTDFAFAGTRSAKCHLDASDSGTVQLAWTHADNVPLNESNGLWQRWYIYTTQSTIDSIKSETGSGIKIMLNRGAPGSQDPPSWIMISINNPDDPFEPDWGFFPDTTLDCGELDGVPNCRGQIVAGGQWYKLKTHYKKNPGGTALAEVWLDDVLQINDTDPVMGSTDSEQRPEVRVGIAFTSNAGPNGFDIYVDELWSGNFDPDA